jgi:hypothetical protein
LNHPHSEAAAPARVEDARVEIETLTGFGSVVLESAEAQLDHFQKNRVNKGSRAAMLWVLAPLGVVAVMAEVLG